VGKIVSDTVWVAWCSTRLRISSDHGLTEVGPAADYAFVQPLVQQTHYFLSAWNPGGKPAAHARNDAAHRDLRAALDQAGIDHVPAAVLAEDASWAQCGVTISGISEGKARSWARDLGQPVLVVRGGNDLHEGEDQLRYLDPGGERVHNTTAWSRPIPTCPCPISHPNDYRTRPCVRRGGPYGGAAMAAAAEWSVRRAVMIRALGCDVCAGATPDGPPGEPIVIVDTQDPAPSDTSVWVTPRRSRRDLGFRPDTDL
jgi:hypothetical protein